VETTPCDQFGQESNWISSQKNLSGHNTILEISLILYFCFVFVLGEMQFLRPSVSSDQKLLRPRQCLPSRDHPGQMVPVSGNFKKILIFHFWNQVFFSFLLNIVLYLLENLKHIDLLITNFKSKHGWGIFFKSVILLISKELRSWSKTYYII
jgi:hypothetical protein